MKLKNTVRLILAFSMILPPGAVSANSSTKARRATNKTSVKPISYEEVFAGDPTWDAFVKGKWDAPKMGPYKAADPVLDENPFFLVDQKWSSAHTNTNSSTRVDEGFFGLTVQLPNAKRELQIGAPLKPLFEDDNYLFFTADSPSVFEDKASDEESYGEGLFFIDKALLVQESFRPDHAGAARPVPVFFLPLIGKGWTKGVQASALSDLDVLALENSSGESMTWDVDDIHLLAKVQRQNLLLATINKLKHQPELIRQTLESYRSASPNIELPFVYPPRGSTAAYGLYYTGVDLENRGRSIHEVAFQKTWAEHMFPEAHADSMLSPDVLERLIVIGQITGTVFVGSVLAKYSILKERVRERRDYIERQDDLKRIEKKLPSVDRSRALYKVKREAIEWIDMFSHGLATVSAVITTATGYFLEYGADRLWRPDAKINKMARKVLEYSFLYNRKQNENIAANAQTFFLGVVVLGGIDVAGVVMQLLLVSPVFFPWAAQAFGDRIHARVSEEFSGESEDTNNKVTSEIMRNLAAYFVTGAYSYSSAQRQKIMEDLRPIIEAKMLQSGRNPYDPKHHRELEARLEREIERMLVERGLPSQKEFLFSSPSTLRAIAHLMGYKVDRSKLVGATDENFVLESARWGLIHHALKRATKAARDIRRVTPSPELDATVRILEDLKRKYHVATRMLTRPLSPIRNVKEAVEARQIMTLLSYEGDLIGGGVKHIEGWDQYQKNPKAAQTAARLFRQSFFALIQAKPYVLQPDTDQLHKFLGQAENEAEKRIDAVIPKDEQTAADKQILALEIVKEKIEDDLHKTSVQNWAPPKIDWYERRQIEQADQHALNQVTLAAIADHNFNSKSIENKPKAIELYRESYRQKMAELVGLHTFPPEKSELVRIAIEAAGKELEDSLNTNEGLRVFYTNLSEQERLKFAAHTYAKAFLSKYVQMTVSNSSVVTLTSPEQPGFFQRLRQTKLVSADTFIGRTLTKSLRAAESVFDNGAYQPGASSWRKRNIPFAGDTKAVFEIKKRQLLTAVTAAWFTNYYMWQVHYPWDTYVFFFATGGFTAIASYWLDRMMINMGIRPMDTTWDKVKYSLFYTWLTYPTYIPFFFFVADWERYTRGAAQKIGEWATEVAASPVGQAATEVVKACVRLLGGG